jgi:hypothetical protein
MGASKANFGFWLPLRSHVCACCRAQMKLIDIQSANIDRFEVLFFKCDGCGQVSKVMSEWGLPK